MSKKVKLNLCTVAHYLDRNSIILEENLKAKWSNVHFAALRHPGQQIIGWTRALMCA